MSPLLAAVSGLGFGLSLIIAIGAQNAFVLRQGLRREHVLAVVAICALADAAFPSFSESPPAVRADFLDAVAEAVNALGESLIARAMAEIGDADVAEALDAAP